MGRELGVGQNLINGTSTYYPLDLFHYQYSPPQVPAARAWLGNDALINWSTRDFSRGGYFSFDNGATKLLEFNAGASGDAGDWAASAGNDAFLNGSSPGVINNVSSTDLSLMDVIGYDRVPSRLIGIDVVGIIDHAVAHF